jgi:hypothetical protein
LQGHLTGQTATKGFRIEAEFLADAGSHRLADFQHGPQVRSLRQMSASAMTKIVTQITVF